MAPDSGGPLELVLVLLCWPCAFLSHALAHSQHGYWVPGTHVACPSPIRHPPPTTRHPPLHCPSVPTGAQPADVRVHAVALAAHQLAHRAGGQAGQAAAAAQHAVGDDLPGGCGLLGRPAHMAAAGLPCLALPGHAVGFILAAGPYCEHDLRALWSWAVSVQRRPPWFPARPHSTQPHPPIHHTPCPLPPPPQRRPRGRHAGW